MALRGFEQFEAALERAWDGGRPDAFTALDRLGKAYLDFARGEPAFYSAMFEAGVPVGANPALRDAGERAFAVLRSAAEAICATMPAAGRPPALMVALHIWALAHGVASLFGARMARNARCPCRRRSSWRRTCWSICAELGVNAAGREPGASTPDHCDCSRASQLDNAAAILK